MLYINRLKAPHDLSCRWFLIIVGLVFFVFSFFLAVLSLFLAKAKRQKIAASKPARQQAGKQANKHRGPVGRVYEVALSHNGGYIHDFLVPAIIAMPY